MKKILRTAAALALAGCMMTANVFAATVFTDVPSNYWGKTFIDQAASAGLVSGMGDGTYGINGKLSSAQFTTMVCNLICKEDVATYQNTYKPAEWWRAYMAVAYSKGFLKNTTVGDARAASNAWSTSVVNAEISRYDMAQIMVNVASAQGWTMPNTTEVLAAQAKIADWKKIPAKYQVAVATAYAKEYLSGMDTIGTFAGDQSMTRTHGAVVICKLLNENKAANNITTPTFTNTTKLVNGKTPTEENVVAALKALKTEFPNGYVWNMNSTYQSVVLGKCSGDEGFAVMLADRVFGNLALEVSKAEDLKPGDVVHLRSEQQYVLVTDISGNEFSYVSCGSTGKVSWGGTWTISDLTEWDTIYTRYEGEGDYASAGDGELSNGKAVTAANVTALIDDFTSTLYGKGDAWKDSASYKSTYFKTTRVYGNEAFAYMLSDHIFGKLPVEEVTDFDTLRVGDVLYIDSWDEYLVVTKISGDTISFIGVYNQEVYVDDIDVDYLNTSDSAYTRYPESSSSSGAVEGELANGKAATTANVKALIQDFYKVYYADGDMWKDSDSYKSTYFKNKRVYGNEAYAYMLSDHIFGKLPVEEVTDFDTLRVGDVIYFQAWDEYLVVTNISGDTISYVGVYRETVYTDTMDVDYLSSDDSAYTRYPGGSTSSSGSSANTLADGKTATAANVKALITKFLSGSNAVGQPWKDTASYKSTYFKSKTVYGNEAFSYKLSDYVFGSLTVKEVSNYNNLRVGDVIYYRDWAEYLVITKISGTNLEVVGVYEESIYTYDLKTSDLDSRDSAWTRYPS